MSKGNDIWIEECSKCGHTGLHEREVDGGEINEIYLECVECGAKYSIDEVIDDFDDELPHQADYIMNPLKGLNPNNLPVSTSENAIYRFRVGRNVVAFNGSDTLSDLASRIQFMHDLDCMHMSSFYMSGKFYDRNHEITCPRLNPFIDDGEADSDRYKLCDLGLYEGQKFVYLHNFMREKRFNIRFIGCTSVEDKQ